MPHLNGLDALSRLKKDHPNVKVVFLTMHQNPAYARRALERGASGFVLKHSAPAELVMAIHAALQGKTFITPAILADVFEKIQHGSGRRKEAPEFLTPRQREILELLAEGRSAKEVADARFPPAQSSSISTRS
jgi:DNA-binding NarL/FixJ family response regulator